MFKEPNLSGDIDNQITTSTISGVRNLFDTDEDYTIDSNETGIAVDVLGDRILGGFETNIENIPWQVSLRRGSQHICGGAIIAPKWILTAAHCTT